MCDGFSKTKFFTKPVGESPDTGIPIGVGACKAVMLKLNAFKRNDIESAVGNTANLPYYIYFGDSNSQEMELISLTPGGITTALAGWSPLIYCENLQEVFVRYPLADGDWPTIAQLQVMVYY